MPQDPRQDPDMVRFRDAYNQEVMKHDPRGRLDVVKTMQTNTGETVPYVPHPAIFQKDPNVIGTKNFANVAKFMYDSNPGLKERIPSMGMVPNKATLQIMLEDGLNPYRYWDNNLGGNRDPNSGNIYINPLTEEGSMGGQNPMEGQMVPYMAHEMSHAMGWQDEPKEYGSYKFNKLFNSSIRDEK